MHPTECLLVHSFSLIFVCCMLMVVIDSSLLPATQLDVNTVAAGGGSRLFFRGGMFVVGPESAGAHPGPACYMKGSRFLTNNLLYF